MGEITEAVRYREWREQRLELARTEALWRFAPAEELPSEELGVLDSEELPEWEQELLGIQPEEEHLAEVVQLPVRHGLALTPGELPERCEAVDPDSSAPPCAFTFGHPWPHDWEVLGS